MDHLRWLLVMEKQTDSPLDELAYRLWLYELDESTEQAPIACGTVDDLLAALLARWDRRAVHPEQR